MPYTVDIIDLRMSSEYFSSKRAKEVEKALAEGKRVQLRLSEFKDPGPDYCTLVIDGVIIEHTQGY